MSTRRTLYTTEGEEYALLALSTSREIAVNTIIRVAIRRLLGLPVPLWAHELDPVHVHDHELAK